MPDGKAVKQRGPGRPFKKGQSGNPNGRPPKDRCVSSLLADLLKGNPQKVIAKWKANPGGPTGAMISAIAFYVKMSRADMTAMKEGLDRVEGRVPLPVEHSGTENGAPIRFTMHFDKPEAETANETAP